MVKIKIVHLLINPDKPQNISEEDWLKFTTKQDKSIEYFSKVYSRFYSSIQVFNNRATSPPPLETCNDPSIYVADPSMAPTTGAWLSTGHYGAFEAHRQAILNHFDEDLDAILVVEGDVVSQLDPDNFSNKVQEAFEFGKRNSAAFITFANTPFGDGHNPKNIIIPYGEYDKIKHFLCCNCYMVFNNLRQDIQSKLKEAKWMAWDVWLYWNYDNRVPMFRLHKPIAFETSGFSFIDFKIKDTNYLP